MSATIKPEQLAKELMTQLKQFDRNVIEKFKEVTIDVGTEGVEKLKAISQRPASAGGTAKPSTPRGWEDYARNWRLKNLSGSNYASAIIHNANYYRVTHLLEDGHMTRDGQRTRAFPHINEVKKYVIKKYQDEIEKVINKYE